jgi:choline kinase
MNSEFTAIILAAGKGTRLRPLTNERPKCMVAIAGKTILERQVEVLNQLGIKKIIVVTGYLEEKISDLRIKKVHNPEFDTTNMVYSLMCARDYLEGDVIVSYGDIVYSNNVLQKLMNDDSDMVITSDEEWLPYWQKRFDDPLSDAETFQKGPGQSVISLGQKPSSKDEVEGQFTGLMKFSAKGCQSIKKVYDDCLKSECSENAWGSGRSLRNAYMTDILNHLAQIQQLHYVPIQRGWFEVDDSSDLEIANRNI